MSLSRLVAVVVAVVVALLVAACGGAQEQAGGAPGAPSTRLAPPEVTPPRRATSMAAPVGASRKPTPDAPALFARLSPALVACYEQGRKTTPTMLDGRLTLNASIDASGKATCVIPSDDTGLTQEVEDCMSSRFAKETFESAVAPWSAALPIVVRGGVVQLGDRPPAAIGIESIETYRMPDAFEVLESLVPELEACMNGLDASGGLRSVLVGARVGADGRTQCALASTSGSLPADVGDCAAGVLRGARFPPPKGGCGLVVVPITLASASRK